MTLSGASRAHTLFLDRSRITQADRLVSLVPVSSSHVLLETTHALTWHKLTYGLLWDLGDGSAPTGLGLIPFTAACFQLLCPDTSGRGTAGVPSLRSCCRTLTYLVCTNDQIKTKGFLATPTLFLTPFTHILLHTLKGSFGGEKGSTYSILYSFHHHGCQRNVTNLANARKH